MKHSQPQKQIIINTISFSKFGVAIFIADENYYFCIDFSEYFTYIFSIRECTMCDITYLKHKKEQHININNN